jgi:hypothetical protein
MASAASTIAGKLRASIIPRASAMKLLLSFQSNHWAHL